MEMLWCLLAGLFLSVSVEADCLPDKDRVDCITQVELSSNQDENILICQRKGCNWCPAGEGTPWCHYKKVERTCGQPLVDCGYLGITKEQCENRACLFSPNKNGDPWCCHSYNTGDDTCPVEVANVDRVDCFPLSEGPSNKAACLSRGCLWCQSRDAGVPWCFYPADRFPDPGPDIERVDCNAEGGALGCLTRGCQYRPTNVPHAPWCFFPRNKGYKMAAGSPHITKKGYHIELERHSSITMYGGSIFNAGLDVEFQTNGRLRLKFYDQTKSRFEVPLDIESPPIRASHPLYDVTFSNDPVFSIKVVRKSTGAVLFDTSIGGLHLEDQFLQFATKLPSDDVYGFGENLHYDFRHDVTKWPSDGMFTRDQPPMEGANLYSVHPVYHVLEKDGNAHGVLILNSAAQDASLTPGPALVYRTIGGILDIYLFLGPSPDNVIQQYTQAVGRPVMPPYWALGFSLAKFGYGHIDSLKDNIKRMRDYKIPQDYQFLDIDYMDRYIDFTYSQDNYQGLPDYMRQQQTQGLKFIAILDPAIPKDIPNYPPLNSGNEMHVWVNHSDGLTPVEGKVWPPTNAYFPDFTNPVTHEWWINNCNQFYNTVPYDGLWIDMNEPANFFWGSATGCPNNKINNPPYWPKIWGPSLFYKTLCPDHKHHIGLHYDVHSLYGWSQAPPTLQAARSSTGKRSLVLSRSTFPGTGKYAVHWLGDNWSRWDSLKASIGGMFEFNMFGMPFIGADICGFIGDTNYELCMRWQEVGAFYPFSRNHNLRYENRDQDPTVWGDEFARVARETLNIRYSLLPFLYTLLHHAHINGTSVVRPLLNVFPTDLETRFIDRQFLWGSSFMVSPVLDQGSTTVHAYFPDSRWFSYYDGREVGTRQNYEDLHTPLEFIHLHIRGGAILPTQQPALNTQLSRKNPMGLIVALDDNDRAEGSLFWDDGESIDTFANGNYTYVQFTATKNMLRSKMIHNGYHPSNEPIMTSVRILGIRERVSQVYINQPSIGLNHTWNQDTKELLVTDLKFSLKEQFVVRWSSSIDDQPPS